MENGNGKKLDKLDLTYEEWVSGGRFCCTEEIYRYHGNGD